MHGRLDASLGERPIEHGAQFSDRKGAVHFLAIDEKRGSGGDAYRISFMKRSLDSGIILPLDAGLQLSEIEIALLTLHQRGAVDQRKLSIVALGSIDHVLVPVKIVGEVPVSIVVLRSEAIGIDRSVSGPGMNFRQRVILVDEQNAIAVFLEDLRKQGLVHARTEGALEVIVVHDDDLGIFIAASGTALDVHFLHDFGIGILGEVELGELDEGLAIFGEQEVVLILARSPIESELDGVVVVEVAGVDRPDADGDVRR